MTSLTSNSAPHEPFEWQTRILFRALALVLSLSITAAIIVAAAGSPSSWVEGLRWAIYMLAAAAVASILGLVFGIPRARSDFIPGASERYLANSNLEQISDWLTKLLVGVGLVELNSVPGAIQALGTYLGSDLHVPNPAAYAATAVVFGAGTGFAAGYLWTRIRLRPILEQSDRDAAELSQKREEVFQNLKKAVASQGAAAERDSTLERAADRAIRAVSRPATSVLPILWVDDHPENNSSIVDALAALGIPVDLASSTQAAIDRLGAARYGLVITDLGRHEGGQDKPMAGLELIQSMRNANIETPIAVFAGERGMQNRSALIAAGATGVFHKTSELFATAVRSALDSVV